MSSLKNVGKSPSQDPNVVNKDYVESLTAQNLSQASVTSLINSGFSSYCLKSYVDQQDALNATLSYIQAGDATKLSKSKINANSGVPGLDSTGKIQANRVNLPSTQRWPKGFWTPSSYLASPISYTSTDATLFTQTITDPGYSYKLVVSGLLNAKVTKSSIGDLFGEYPVIYVRVGAADGPIIAQGYGCAEHYQWGMDLFERTSNSDLGPFWAQEYFGSGSGTMATPDGHQARWIKSGTGNRGCRARRVNPLDATTIGDTQYITWWVGDNDVGINPGLDSAASNSILGRMSSDGKAYVRLDLNYQRAALYYSVNGNEQQFPGTYSITQGSGDSFTLVCGSNGNPRQFALLKNWTQRTTWSDSNGVSALGGNYRGWGIGMNATTATAIFPVDQHPPADMTLVWIQDPLNPAMADLTANNQGQLNNVNRGPINIVPTPLSSQSVWTGAKTLYVTGSRVGSSATMSITTVNPSVQAWAVPA